MQGMQAAQLTALQDRGEIIPDVEAELKATAARGKAYTEMIDDNAATVEATD